MIQWSPSKTAWFLLMGVPGVIAAPWALSVETASVAAGLGFGSFLFGHTVGLHRRRLHRSFGCPRWLEVLLIEAFVLTGIGGPLRWIRAHNQRDRWQNAPTAPAWFRYDHGLWRDAWWNLHTVYVEPAEDASEADRADPWLRFCDLTWPVHVALSFGLIAALGGWAHLMIAGFLRVWVGMLFHWYVGFEAHRAGEVRFPIHGAVETGRNRPWLGILSLGEGFHNNHHARPQSAQIGLEAWEIDAGWAVIQALEAVGLAWDVKRPHEVPFRGAPSAAGEPPSAPYGSTTA